MTDKIKSAATATDQVQTLVETALDNLHGFTGRAINGFGVYSDWSSRRNELRLTLAAIEGAIKVMRETDWPTDADFDRAET